MVGGPNCLRHRIRDHQRPHHRRHRRLHRRVVAAPTQHPPWLGHYRRDHQRHCRRAVAAPGPSTCSRRRALGKPLGLAPVSASFGGHRVLSAANVSREFAARAVDVLCGAHGLGAGCEKATVSRALVPARLPPAATSASRASAGSDFEPVLFMMEARWFSTVRWLMPRSAAIFLLGWPASTRSITSRCRGVRPARCVAADSRHSCNLLESSRQFESPLDAGDQFLAADRLFDEIQRARFHRFDRHRHVAVAGDHDRGHAMAVVMELLQQLEPAHSRQIGVDQQARGRTGAKGLEKRFAARIGFDDAAVVLQDDAQRLANLVVVIDDEDLGESVIAWFFSRASRGAARARRAAWPKVSRWRGSTLST